MPHIEVIARALITSGSRVLLCRNIAHDYFYLPGGHVEFGESAHAAVLRELHEEGNIRATAGECLLVHENLFTDHKGKQHHELNAVFRVTLAGAPDDIRSMEEAISLDWVDLSALVDLDLRPEAAKAWLASGAHPCPWLSTMSAV